VLLLVGALVIYFSLNALLADFEQNQPGNFAPARVSHWSGYLVNMQIQNKSQGVSSISASWTVPQVEFSQNDTFSSIWIGVGGYGEQTLIQTGTEQHCLNGRIEYFAWYELLPDKIVSIPNLNVQPGDLMTSTIRLVNEGENTWSITLNDLTNGRYFEKTVVYNSSQLSAEWIVERPLVQNVMSTLANFGNVTINSCSATIGNTTGAIDNFAYTPVIMVNSQNADLTKTSSLSGDGLSFNVTYLEPPSNSTI
jgi:hypothetical protein